MKNTVFCAISVVLLALTGCSAEIGDDQGAESSAPKALLGADLVVNGTLQTLDGEQVYDNISVINGGTLQVTDYDTTGTTGTLLLRARVSVTVDATSSIVANAAGFRGGLGGGSPTAGEGLGGGGAAPNDGGGGGGHAGVGANGTLDNNCGVTEGLGGISYGSADVTDVTMGSGGGGGKGGGANGGDGGGAIVISAPTVTIAGNVSSNGGPGVVGSGDSSGGGSGGSIIIVANSVDCTGTLSAVGANGGNTDDDGGGGSGGWVKVSAQNTLNACTVQTGGGTTGSCGTQGGSGQNPTDTDGLAGSYCGNSTTEAWEGCDDGGTADSDGCNSQCLIETGDPAPCEFSTQCVSNICTGSFGSPGECASCVNDVPGDGQDTGCSGGAPICDVSGTPTCVVCMDDATGTNADIGCSGGTLYCDTTGTPVCVAGCSDDGTGDVVDQGCSDPTRHCDESGSNPICIVPACEDDADGSGVDEGCTDPARHCDLSGSNPACATPACEDDQTGTTPDTACLSPTEFCDESDAVSNPMCVAACSDTQSGNGGLDDGCTESGGSELANACDVLASNPTCVDCTETADCDGDDFCNVAIHECAPGCESDDDCNDTLETPVCDTSGVQGVCVECTANSDCGASQVVCSETACFADVDENGVPDVIQCPDGFPCDDDEPDAGVPDAGAPDAGRDGGSPDGGSRGSAGVAGGGGCSVTATPVFTSSLWSMLGLLGLVVRRRRRRS